MVELAYLQRGDLNGTPLIFLHGFLGNKEDFLPLIEALGEQYLSFAVDLPGHGETPLEMGGDDLWRETLLALERFLDQHQLIKASFVGYSMGGRILLRFWEEFRQRIDHLFILSAHLGLSRPEEAQEKWGELLQKGNMDQFLLEWYAQPLFASLKKDSVQFQHLMEKRKKNNPHFLKKALEGFSLAKQKQYREEEGIYFFYGEHDVKYRELYGQLKKKYEIKKSGHAIHLEAPLQIAEIIKREEDASLESSV